jgi:hypothetical protein
MLGPRRGPRGRPSGAVPRRAHTTRTAPAAAPATTTDPSAVATVTCPPAMASSHSSASPSGPIRSATAS